MNLPNKLTVLRIILTPIFMVAFMVDLPLSYFVAMIIFIVASITDMLDGQIARKHNMVTDFGKFMDPLADKMLTTAAFIGFVHMLSSQSLPWVLFIVLIREFAVMSVRLLAAKDGVVVAASFMGKLKTVIQMVAIIYMLVFRQAVRFMFVREFLGGAGILWGSRIGIVLIWVSVVATVVSGIQYIWQLRHHFKETAN